MVKVFAKGIAWPIIGSAIALVSPSPSIAQGTPFSVSVYAGSETERYLRALALVGQAPAGQWTIRAFGPLEVASASPRSTHPWQSQRAAPSALPTSGRYSLVTPSLRAVGNSGFPYGFNDGPAWAGRGLTLVASSGVRASRGAFSVVIDPIAFVAMNADFRIADNGLTGDRRFAEPTATAFIDLPQRFGASAYARVDPGESEARIERHGIAAGISTRADAWGPASDHPLILGNNAGGIPRIFAGTSAPADLGWVTVHGRVIWGRLQESRYGPDTGIARRHFATGVVGSLGVKGVPGLELGVARFFHASWPQNGLRHAPWLRVLQEFINSKSTGADFATNPDNQLASAFIRVAPAGQGFEVYGEFGREDRNATFRDLLLEPDHIGAYMLGFARAWSSVETNRITVVRGEVLNTRISHLQQQRSQSPWYVHGSQAHGHTQRGQVLGSAGGFGGGASLLAIDRYVPSGRATIRWDRVVRATPVNSQGLPVQGRTNLTHALGFERVRFTRRGELTTTVALVQEFNRHFAGDAFNVNVGVGYRILR